MLGSIKRLRVCACSAEYEAEVLRQAREWQQQQAQLPSSDALFNLLVQAGMSDQVGAVTLLFFTFFFIYPLCLPMFFFTCPFPPGNQQPF